MLSSHVHLLNLQHQDCRRVYKTSYEKNVTEKKLKTQEIKYLNVFCFKFSIL